MVQKPSQTQIMMIKRRIGSLILTRIKKDWPVSGLKRQNITSSQEDLSDSLLYPHSFTVAGAVLDFHQIPDYAYVKATIKLDYITRKTTIVPWF